jgi:hypothetical protein
LIDASILGHACLGVGRVNLECRSFIVTASSGHRLRLAYIAKVIDVQDPNCGEEEVLRIGP